MVTGYLIAWSRGWPPARLRKAAGWSLPMITPHGLTPVYKIPAPHTTIPGHDTVTGEQVRTMQQQVGRVGLEPTTGGL